VRPGGQSVTFSKGTRDSKPWSVYCIFSTTGRKTYLGASVNVNRRLRQHNGELKGGARATHWGRPWVRLCHVQGFPNERTALQFEWRWKNLSTTGSRRKKGLSYTPTKTNCTPFDKLSVGHPALKKRLIGLWRLAHCPRYTSNAPPASSIPLTIVWEDPTRVACRKALEKVLPSHIRLICRARVISYQN
jgi:predicted GIY-YIG superfamily endonuclease